MCGRLTLMPLCLNKNNSWSCRRHFARYRGMWSRQLFAFIDTMNYYTANSCSNHPADMIIIQRIQEVNQISVPSVKQPWATGSPPAFTIVWEHCVCYTRSKWLPEGDISTISCWFSYRQCQVFVFTTPAVSSGRRRTSTWANRGQSSWDGLFYIS